jgi:CubicO group peptidase (beta-lactamase class C family)
VTVDPRAPLAVFLFLIVAVWFRALTRALRGALKVGVGYKAKALCSALFVSRLDLDVERAPEIADEAYRPMRLFRARVDRGAESVTVSWNGLFARTATRRPGWGATLALGPVAALPAAIMPTALKASAPWPEGEASAPDAPPALARVLDAAFRDDGPKKRRTRAVLVARGGRLLAEGYAPGFAASTPLNGWSMTKSAFGALLGTLVGEGRLSASSRGLLPQWRATGDRRADIALEDLLRMRSGLLFSEAYDDLNSDVNRMLFVEPDAGGFAASRPLAFRPGSRWQYASGTSNILSLVARRSLGDRDYWTWPRRALFEPLGMTSAVLEPDASGTFLASSYLIATARDWARLGLLMARDGVWAGVRVLPEGWVRFLTTPTPQSPNGRYGAHWWLKLSKELGGLTQAAANIPADAFHALGHEGQCLTVIPSLDLVVVRLGLSIDITAWDHAAFLSQLLAAL